MLISGINPLIAYRALFEASFGSLNSISETMVKACPLLLCGLGTIVAFRCKFWNIGAEGQIYAGGIAATLVGNLPLPSLVHIPLMVLAGAVGGALYAFIPSFLKVKLKINEVITTIMFDYIAVHLVGYLVHGPMKGAGFLPMSERLPPSAWLPRLIPATRFHLGILIALAAAGVVYFLIWKTVLGFRIRTVGENLTAARLGGINPVSVVPRAGKGGFRVQRKLKNPLRLQNRGSILFLQIALWKQQASRIIESVFLLTEVRLNMPAKESAYE